MENFGEYSHAFASLVLFTLIVLLLSPFSALSKQKAGMSPGATPANDYSDRAYRLNRAYLNGTETLPAFLAVAGVAILAGANPFWVNLLASLVLVFRVLMLVFHVGGIGSPFNGPRTFAYVAGWICLIILGVLALVAVF